MSNFRAKHRVEEKSSRIGWWTEEMASTSLLQKTPESKTKKNRNSNRGGSNAKSNLGGHREKHGGGEKKTGRRPLECSQGPGQINMCGSIPWKYGDRKKRSLVGIGKKAQVALAAKKEGRKRKKGRRGKGRWGKKRERPGKGRGMFTLKERKNTSRGVGDPRGGGENRRKSGKGGKWKKDKAIFPPESES